MEKDGQTGDNGNVPPVNTKGWGTFGQARGTFNCSAKLGLHQSRLSPSFDLPRIPEPMRVPTSQWSKFFHT